jgi:hypothetical protein
MNLSARNSLGYVVAGLAGLVVGYFGGREHLKYEMRSVFQSALQNIQQGFAPPSPGEAPGSRPTPAAAPPAPKTKMPPPLAITLLHKGFKAANIQANDFEDDITFNLSIANLTNQDIRAFDGTLLFTDLLDNAVISINLAINDPIKSNDALKWNGAIKYNQFMDRHQRLKNEDIANLKVNFVAKKILFSDGTSKGYE